MALVITDVSEDRIASIIRVTKIGELETLTVTSNSGKLRRSACELRLLVNANAVPSSPILNPDDGGDTSVFTRST
jgi:hypothetical protein